MSIHAGETYLAMRLDALVLALNDAQIAVADHRSPRMIERLREVRNQADDVLRLLDTGQ